MTINVELAWVSLTTAMCMAGGMFGAAITSRGHVLTSMVGLLAGAVAICAGASIVHPLAAFVIGIVAGVITTFVTGLVEYKLHIDDATACFPVHAACGIWGVIATGLFGGTALGAHPIYGFADVTTWINQIGIQAIGAVSIALWAGAMGLIMFTALKKLNLLRVSRDAELYGLDIALHKTLAYPEDMMEEK
jgi:Amt family ammonium transporter